MPPRPTQKPRRKAPTDCVASQSPQRFASNCPLTRDHLIIGLLCTTKSTGNLRPKVMLSNHELRFSGNLIQLKDDRAIQFGNPSRPGKIGHALPKAVIRPFPEQRMSGHLNSSPCGRKPDDVFFPSASCYSDWRAAQVAKTFTSILERVAHQNCVVAFW
jgi:hypothetical protein